MFERKLIFRLDGVPEDEAEEVRQLLDRGGVEYYETPGGKWGISVAGLWLKDAAQREDARNLLENYARERERLQRESYNRKRESGEADDLTSRMRNEPFRLLAYLAFAALILYFSIFPFFSIAS